MRRSHSRPPFRPNRMVLNVPSGDWCVVGWQGAVDVGGAPTVPRSARGRGARGRAPRGFGVESSAPSPGCAGTPISESGCSGRSGAAGDRSVRFKQVSCSMGLRCMRPMYKEPGVCSANGDGDPSAAGEWR